MVYGEGQTRQEVHNVISLREKSVYKTCPTLGINSNSEWCFNEIDTRVPNVLDSVYEATSPARKRDLLDKLHPMFANNIKTESNASTR